MKIKVDAVLLIKTSSLPEQIILYTMYVLHNIMLYNTESLMIIELN